MEHVNCPFNSPGCTPEPCWEENGYTGLRCPRCGVIYLTPRPDPLEMAALYDADTAGGASAAGHLTFTHERRLDAQYALDFIESVVQKRCPEDGAANERTAEEYIEEEHAAEELEAKKRTAAERAVKKHTTTLLEIGPGGGQFLREARARTYLPHAVELNAAQASFLAEHLNIPTHHGAITDPDVFTGTKFDVIFHRDLVSHLHEPVATFESLRSRLAPGGVMVFETGNGGDLSPRWLRYLARLSYPEHLYLFGERSLKTLLAASGFEPIVIRRHSIVPWLTAIRTIRAVRPKPPQPAAAETVAAAATASGDSRDASSESSALPKLPESSESPASPEPPRDTHGNGTPRNLQCSGDLPGPPIPAVTSRARIKGRLVHTVKYRAFRWLPRQWPSTLLIAARRSADRT